MLAFFILLELKLWRGFVGPFRLELSFLDEEENPRRKVYIQVYKFLLNFEQ